MSEVEELVKLKSISGWETRRQHAKVERCGIGFRELWPEADFHMRRHSFRLNSIFKYL